MGLMQAAHEASKFGFNLVLDGATIGLIVTNVFILLRLRKSGGNSSAGPGEKPGTAKICAERGERLATVEEKGRNIENDIGEIKDDIRAIKVAVIKTAGMP